MADLSNSQSLTEFQRNARATIERLKKESKPLLITVNGKVQAILVDPKSFEEMERSRDRERLIQEIREGERAIAKGQVRPALEVLGELQDRYDLPD